MNLTDQANNISMLMIENYPELKYDSRFTLWGFAFHWDEKMSEKSDGIYRHFIPELFDHMRTKKIPILDPPSPIPERRGLSLHYVPICLVNRSSIEGAMASLLEESIKQEALEIISDKKLLIEAATCYCELKDQKELGNDVDFFNFLLRYIPNEKVDIESKKINGVYLPLAERLVYRFGNKPENKIFSDSNEHVRRAEELHQAAVYGEAEIEPEIRAMYTKFSGENKTRAEPERKLRKVLSMSIPGPIRIRRTPNDYCTDWQAFSEDRKREIKVSRTLNPKEIYLTIIKHKIIDSYMDRFSSDPVNTLANLEQKVEESSGIEKQILEEVFSIYKGAYQIIKSPTLNHKMRIISR